MAYSWYRCGRAINDSIPVTEKIATCLRLCNTDNKHLLRLIENIPNHTDDADISQIFTTDISLSEGISKQDWIASMLVQPQLFIRVRKALKQLTDILEEEQVPYSIVSDDCIALPNGTPIDRWFPEYAYVVQDMSSQKTGNYFAVQPYDECWDCCCGAGGKSLLLKDKHPLAELTVSDTRKTILNNLKDRFRTYSHIMPTVFKVDVSNAQHLQSTMPKKQYDHIICDVPCSGSGTWARTPEQMYFFDSNSISEYNNRQKQIAINAARYLKPNGKLYYITCSVFKEENEAVISDVVAQAGLTIENQEIINGITDRADSMFVAVLSKATNA